MRKFRNNHFGQSRIFGKRVYFDMDPAMNNDSSDVLQGDPSTGGDGNDEPNEDAETIESLKAKLDELLAENYNDVDELESQFRRLETSPEDVLSFMVSFLVQRAKGEDCIYFSCF